jgi:hypothetical protein
MHSRCIKQLMQVQMMTCKNFSYRNTRGVTERKLEEQIRQFDAAQAALGP